MPLRIALLNQYYAPAEAATAQLLSDLGEYLAAEGHDVSAICSRRSYPDPSQLYPARENLGGVSVFRTWTTGFGRVRFAGRLLDYLFFLAGAARILILQRRFDVIVSLTTPPLVALLGVWLARLRRTRSLFWVMDVYPEVAFELGALRADSWHSRIFRRLSRYTLRRSSCIVATGERMAERLGRLGARDPRVIHNWADGEAIRPTPSAGHALRAEWGWCDRFVVLYSGNMGLAHDFDTALEAAEMLRDDPRILFAFIGGGPRRAEVEREVARRGLNNVEFKPHVAREVLDQSLTAGDVHLVTLRQGIPGLLVPSKIYGVLAAGRPTIYVGPEGSEIADILAEGGCGARLALGDGPGLADCVRRYAGDEPYRLDQGARARALFERRFTKKQALRSHLATIRALAEDDR